MSSGQSEITESEKITLFALIAVNRPLYLRAKQILTSELFPETDNILQFWFECLREIELSLGVVPNMATFRPLLSAKLDEQEISVEASDIADIENLWNLAKNLEPDAEAYLGAGQIYLTQYIRYCHRLSIATQLTRNVDLSKTLDEASQAVLRDSATDDTLFTSAFLADLDARPEGRFISVGLDFIDLYCGGGGPGTTDVLGHAAPRGGGKSTLVNQVAVNIALAEQRFAAAEKRPPRVAYVFNYERVEDPLIHTLTYAGKIDRSKIEQYVYTKDVSQLSKGRDYSEYERQRFNLAISRAKQGQGEWPLAELERLAATRTKLATNLFVADFSGRKLEYIRYAGNFVKGIAEFIEMHQIATKRPGVAFVGIDYAGSCVRVHMSATNKSADKYERPLIEDLPLQSKRLIANKYLTFVWVAQQLAADEASRKPGTRPDPNKFKNCKAFAENCDFAIVNGVPTSEGLTVFVQSKARRGDPRPDTAARLNGPQCCWLSAGAKYVIESGTVITREQARFMGSTNSSEEFAD